MCELKKIMVASDSIHGSKSKIVRTLDEIIKGFYRTNGLIMELPWESDISGEYLDKIYLTITKVTSRRVFFINPIKVSNEPCEIKVEDKKGFPRTIESDKTESVTIDFLRILESQGKLRGIVPI